MLLTEFDPAKSAVIDPQLIAAPVAGFPDVTISIFSRKLFQRMLALFPDAREICCLHSATALSPVYEVEYGGERFALFQSFVGAPACVSMHEDAIAMGSRRIILLGNCGVLDPDIHDCSIIIPDRALRDEGTSFHYAPPSEDIAVNQKYAPLFREVLQERGISFVEGATWTTDAPYRETRDKVERRRAQGAICVEMECSAMQALCGFRGVDFFQYLYAGDNLGAEAWEPRSLSGGARLDDKEKLALLAFELGLKIKTND